MAEPVEEDLYKFDDAKLASKNIDMPPASLYEAIDELRKNKLIQDALGDREVS